MMHGTTERAGASSIARHPFALDPAIAAGLRELARQEHATLFMTLLAGFATLRVRGSMQDDLPISAMLGRGGGIAWSNAILVRAELGDNPAFREALARVRAVVQAAGAPELGAAAVAQLEVAFVFDELAREDDRLAAEPELFGGGAAALALALRITATPEGVRGAFEYRTEAFEPPAIERMAEQLVRLLEAIAAEPDRRVGDLPVMSDAEARLVVIDWNATQRDYPRDRCIHELFEAVVDHTPDAIAVELAGARLSYRALDHRANQLAHHLRRLGVGPDVLVAICVERSLEMVIGLLAILKAGGGYVPLDPGYPAERLTGMLDDAAATIVVTLDRFADRFAGPLRIVRLDAAALAGEDASRPDPLASPDHLAYVDFTSGSTGRPKGVCVPHRAVVRLVRDTSYIELSPDDVLLQLAPLAFDASTFELWGALLAGAKLVVFPPQTPSLDELGRVLVDHEITVLFLTTSLFNQMVDHRLGDLARLRCLLAGGEVASVPRILRAVEAVRGTFLHVYGPTENTTFTCYHEVPRTLRAATSIPIGRPIANTTVYILDVLGAPVPIGVTGELYTGGDGLARGYLQRPSLTDEKFVANPFGPGRLYRTGDLARWLPDGTIDFVGRLDHQVKIRGFRVELGEVEAALARCPDVQETVVIAREDGIGNKRLLAYLIAASARRPAAAELRGLLGATLPDYMIPSAFVWLDHMPLTPSGKLDRRALPAPDGPAEPDASAPRTPVEIVIARIWAFVLDVASVSRDDDFFDLGGYSLAVTESSAQIFEALGVEVEFDVFFDHSTVAQLAAALLAAGDPDAVTERAERVLRGAARGDGSARIPRRTAAGLVPLSMSQDRLWLIESALPAGGVRPYNETASYTFEGPLDVELLRGSLHALAERHEILRTVFVEHDHGAAQRVSDANPFARPLALDDLRALSPAAQRAHLEALAEADSRRALLGAHEPPLRARLLRLADATHVLLLTTHHAITDGWSDTIFLRELAALYRAAASGQPVRLAPLAIQYSDFAVWERDRLSGDHLRSELAYWAGQLRGAPPSIAMPLARSPKLATFRGACAQFVIEPAIAEPLRELARRERATLFMPLLGAFATLLFRYSNQDDLPIGAVIANREHLDTQDLIGFFTNTVVLRVDVGGDPSFREVLERVRGVVLAAQAHQEVPFDRVVAELGASRSDGKNPLFQIAFVFEEAVPSHELVPGLRVDLEFLHNGTAAFDLTLGIRLLSSGLVGQLEYNADLFDRATIERMIGHYRTLLAGIVADPGCRIGDLPILTEREHGELVTAWSGARRPYPRDLGLHELFEAQVDRAPDAIAVVLDGAQLSYGELERAANRLAGRLIALGVGPEVTVGLCVERSLDMIVGLFGILKAGGAYVPLDPASPRDRVAFVLEDAAVAVIVTQDRLAATLAPHGARLVCVDADRGAPAGTAARPARRATGDSLAYVTYTSGSTGRPKGVAIEHRMAVNLVLGFGALEQMSPSDRSLGFSSIAFDGSVDEIFTPLSHGATLVLRGEDVPTAAELFGDRFYGVTIINITTAYWHSLAAALDGGHHTLPAALRLVNIGGERARPEHVAAWHAVAPGCRLQNLYGPTETTAIATVWQLHPEQLRPGREVPIGAPLPNYTAYVLDPRGRPVPIGVPGELHLGGDGVARGYLNRPELTAEKFVASPFGPGRLYRTGDIARWFPDGTLEFLGRIDHQVKIRGFRIEPGEIEAALAEHPAVHHAVVIAREDAPGEPRLVAYVVGRDGAIPAAELRAFVKPKLPDYMVPFAFVAVERIPITANGKLDLQALPAPDPDAAVERHVAPRTPAELLLAGIWAAVLRRERIGVDDDFFALGGHSLLATQVASRVRQAFRVELPLRSLFESPTVAELAAVIEAARGAVAPAIEPVARDGELALSFAQQRLWFLDQLAPGSSAYNMSSAIRLDGELDTAALERALDGIVARHEVLRTTFESRGGRAVQRIAPAQRIALPIIDAASPGDALAIAAGAARRPFDLARGPLFGATLLRLGAREHWLVLAMHHIVSDLWSVGVFMEELAALYGGRALPALRIQYADFAAWQRGWLAGDVLDRQLAYWRAQLAGAPAQLELPTDRPRPPVLGSRGATVMFHVPAQLRRALEASSREHSATLFMTLVAAFQVLLHRYTGQDDIVVGSPVANRNRAETEPLIGFFVNTLALRTDLSGNPSFRELVGRVREVALGAYGHQDVPFEKLVEDLQPERSLARAPVFQVMFALETTPPEPVLAGLAHSPITLDTATAKFDLTVAVEDRPDGLAGAWEYNTELFDAPTIERMIGHFLTLLAAIAADAGRRIGELPLLTAAEHRQLVGWNATERPYPRASCAHELFEAQVVRSPDAIAVEHAAERLTYREVDRRANQLAHHLRARGVGPDALVGVCLERRPALVIALVAVWKAGGAYVPLDPALPRARLRLLLGDAGARLVVTDAAHRAVFADDQAAVCVDRDAAAIAAQPDHAPGATAAPDHLAYVMYTSGSTGAPKGVMIEHRGLVNYLAWAVASYAPASGDAVPVHSSIGFDLTVTAMFPPLISGGRIELVRDDAGGQHLVSAVRRSAGSSLVKLTPAHLQLLGEQLGDDGVRGRTRLLVIGGEQLSAEALARWREHAPETRLVNEYGPTETVVGCCVHEVGPDDPRSGPVIIGRPIANTQLHVLDGHGNPQPIGVTGELYIGGDGVGRGYLNLPELTEQRFVIDRFSQRPGARLYRTGDLARRRADGALEYLGRLDDQVKLRGYRIELGEIEAALADMPELEACAVVVREDAPGGKQLAGYLVARGEPPELVEVRRRLADRLPDYMIPAQLVFLDRLPLTPNGKVDRKALAASARATSVGRPIAPRTATELAVAQIFEQLLGTPAVGARDDFFALGGHSLLAIQLVSAIESRLGAALPIAALFRARTVEALAGAIDALPRQPAAPADREAAAPASGLVVLRRDGDGIPVVLIHPIGGTVFCYLDLVARLAPGRPCYAIQASGLAAAPPLASVDAMAHHYAELVERALGGGPCHLFGWSFGGVVALELARAMALRGRDVVSTTLLDSYAAAPVGEPADAHEVIGWFARDLGIELAHDELAGLDRDRALAHLVGRAADAAILPAHLGVAELARYLRVFEANLGAAHHHQAQPFSGDVTLITASEHEPELDPSHGFRSVVTGSLELRSMPGQHDSLLRPPHVEPLARVLDGVIAAAEARRGATRVVR
jgi:amino acid adenylation domain-containing protein